MKVSITGEPQRRTADLVIGVPGGPSARGSTYWTRVLSCPRQHFLANVVGWKSTAPSDPLDTGLLWHAMLEDYYRARWAAQCRARPKPAGLVWSGEHIRDQEYFRLGEREGTQAAFAILAKVAAEPGYEKIHDVLARMFDSYLDFARFDRWEILAVEHTLYVPASAGHGFEYSARMDLNIIDHSQHTPVTRGIEHKSAYRLDGDITSGYTQDLQTLGQVWLMHYADLSAWGALPPLWGNLVNITSKGKLPKHERVPVNPGPVVLDNWARGMRAWEFLRTKVWAQLEYPQNFASCSRRYGRCPYFSLCQARPDWTPKHVADMPSPPAGFVSW